MAASFARIFYRNAVNIGLPILECPEAAAEIEQGDRLTLDFETGRIVNETKGTSYRAVAFPPFMRRIMDAGGLTSYVRERLAGAGSESADMKGGRP